MQERLFSNRADHDGMATLVGVIKNLKADSTLRSSQAVPHPSTNRALCCLTSEVERDPVHSTRYGRRRMTLGPKCLIYTILNTLS